MFRKLLENHILTNLTFMLVLVMGWINYYQLPREQDPSVNFNWVQITVLWPGATAPDVENRITDQLEEGIKKVPDIKFVSSTSREGISTILIRFNEMDDDEFDRHVADLRRELQAKRDELPDGADQPEIAEVSSSNAFPTATVVLWGYSDGEELQRFARNIKEDLERIEGVDSVADPGARDPELHVHFLPARLLGMGISPVDLADTVSAYFRDLSAGDITLGDQKWLVRMKGTSSDPRYLESFPIVSARGEVPLRSIAEIERGHEDAQWLVRYRGQPAVLLYISKEDKANNLELLEKINTFIQQKNQLASKTGVELVLLDDQTEATRSAISVMERNALIGLLLVMLMTWLFLGFKIALFTSIGIPFVLAGTFWMLGIMDQTLNVTVLLGIVISLGMLVDDAVVVVEAIYFHLQRGKEGLQAALDALRDVAGPVTTAVLTTIAAFLPLMLLPGLLGDFMRVVPIVVTVALIVSLIEAFWMLPSHIAEFQPDLLKPGRAQAVRNRITRQLRHIYTKFLLRVLRSPKHSLGTATALLLFAVALIVAGFVRIDFFATDFFRLFYIGVQMPPGTSLEKTSATLELVNKAVIENLKPGVARGIVNYAGFQLTETEAHLGDERGQIFVSLESNMPDPLDIDKIIASLRDAVNAIPGPLDVSFLRRKTGPPTSKPISIKVRGNDIREIRSAVVSLKKILSETPGVSDITDDDFEGGMELSVQLNPDAVSRSGLNPSHVARAVRLFADGEVVASMQHQGEKLDVRVRAKPESLQEIDTFLGHLLGLPDGREIALGELLKHSNERTVSNIRHYNFRRAVTVEAELDTGVIDTLTANRRVQEQWRNTGTQFPGISLDFSGEMDDIKEGLGAMGALFLLGMGLIYLILGTQFKSYLQPFIVLATVPMAFIGVVLGLFISMNPMSMFTLYGAIALAGIAANDAIVLISTANRNLNHGWPVATAVVYAARRRVVPILITSLTTMAGLFSLATGLGGKSLMWGPVATTIVWGLGFSTLLTLFIIPLGYNILIKPKEEKSDVQELTGALVSATDGWLAELFVRIHKHFSSSHKVSGQELENVLKNHEYKQFYTEGLTALNENDPNHAIRNFQQLADMEPKVKDFNIHAAQANILLMQQIGWDLGYMARARRYLMRARNLDAHDHRLAILEKAYVKLEEEGEKGAEGNG